MRKHEQLERIGDCRSRNHYCLWPECLYRIIREEFLAKQCGYLQVRDPDPVYPARYIPKTYDW